jgi:catechol 2,3-dioxygenase-like lactoylglutathione lyase family enzyme
MISAMKFATVGVSDLDYNLRLYRDVIGLKQERRYALDRSVLTAWGLPLGTQAEAVELSCKGYPMGQLRLVKFSPASTQRVRFDSGVGATDTGVDIGPKAIDFYVRAPISASIDKLEAFGLKRRSNPVLHQVDDVMSEELLFSGPDGLPLLLMVGHVHPPAALRPGSPDGEFSEIATISIVAGGPAQSRRFYGDALGMEVQQETRTKPEDQDKVNELTGTPQGTRIHWLIYTGAGEPSGKILLVHFFENSGKRLKGRMQPGNLGFSLLTHLTADVDAVTASVARHGFEVMTPPTTVQVAGASRRIALVRGPNEELLELSSA